MSRTLAARAAAALAFAACGLTLAPAAEAQRTIDYSSRIINCEFLGAEYERIKQANIDGIPGEGAWLTILRVLTFPMYLMEPFVGYSGEKPVPLEIGGQANFSGDVIELEAAMRRLNCIAPLRQYDEDEAAGLVATLKPAPLGRRVRSDGFFYGLPFK